MDIIITNHFRERFKHRLANTNKINEYTNNAYNFGKEPSRLAYLYLETKEASHGSTCRIYKNYVYWFRDNAAITIYPLPQKYHIRKEEK